MVGKEMYTFFDRGDRSITLRPEGTAGVVRSLIWCSKPKEECSACGTRANVSLRTSAGRAAAAISSVGSGGVRECRSASGCGGDCDRYGYSAKPRAENLRLDLNSVGNLEDRQHYRQALVDYLTPYKDELDPILQCV